MSTTTAPEVRKPAERQGGGCLLFVLGLSIGVPLLALSGLTIAGPPSIETGVFTIGVLLGVVGCLAAPWRNTRALVLSAVVLVLGVVIYRYFAAAEGTTVHESAGPHGGEARWTDRIIPERDVALGGSGLLIATGRMPVDQPGLMDALRDGYSRMEQAEGPVPSAVVGTFLFGQSADDHSLFRVAPPRYEPPQSVVIFLHGFIGSVTLLCWQVAQAANPVGLDVVCPAADWEARWAEPEGVRTIEATIAALRAQGVRRIYLAGLSAGAIGASRLAPRLDVEGVVLISGASSLGRASGKPTLVLQGALDRMTPATHARAYARRAHATYEEHPEAGHWLLLSHHEWAMQHMRRWLAEQEGAGEVQPVE
jgi:predicted esterase